MPNQNPETRDPTGLIRPRRPILLTLILWVFGLWTVLGWLRFVGALANRALIFEFLPVWGFWYLLFAGLVWGLVGLPIIWGLFTRAAWVKKALPAAALIYPLVYWSERVFVWQSGDGQLNWRFMLLLTGLWLALVIWAIASRQVRDYLANQGKGNQEYGR